jgi:hypothetical protein
MYAFFVRLFDNTVSVREIVWHFSAVNVISTTKNFRAWRMTLLFSAIKGQLTVQEYTNPGLFFVMATIHLYDGA